MSFYFRQTVYRTEKTLTKVAAVLTNNGVLSLKRVESANGHKVELFSGFDPIPQLGNALDEEGYTPAEFLDAHRYGKADRKACDKWGGVMEEGQAPTPEYLMSALGHMPLMTAKALDHWHQAFGYVPSDEDLRSAKLKDSNDRMIQIAEANAAALVRKKEAHKTDALWGMF